MADPKKTGVYLPTTANLELDLIQSTDINDPKFKELIVRLYQFVNKIALVVNKKTSGFYTLTEFVDGNLFFKNPLAPANSNPQFRQEFRTTVNFGPLPGMGITLCAPHGITVTTNTTWTGVGGAGTKSTAPFAGVLLPNQDLLVTMDSMNVCITAFSDYSMYDRAIVILTYLQS